MMDTRLKAYRKRADNASEGAYRAVQTLFGIGTSVATSAFAASAFHEIANGNKASGVAHAVIGTVILAFGTAEILGSRSERNQKTLEMLRKDATAGNTNALELLAKIRRDFEVPVERRYKPT